MNPAVLCNWLGLKDTPWPPDPYSLLGVAPGETDVARIEQSVHERLCRLRCYQISHPEEATEGMNRLAQAFIEVTDCLCRAGKRCTPVTIAVAHLPGANGTRPAVKSGATVKKRDPAKEDTAVGRKTEIDWRQTPPPVRSTPEVVAAPAAAQETVAEMPAADRPTEDIAEAQPAAVAATGETGANEAAVNETTEAEGSTTVPAPAAPSPPAAPPAAPVDEAFELAFRSPEACRGLSRLPALVDRINQTRHLAVAWKRVGKYIRNPQRKLSKPAEETDLTQRMDFLFEVIEDYPAFIGHPGKPGYRVVAMARLEMTAMMFKGLDTAQREELAKDWDNGEKVLRQHRRFLLRELKARRRRGPVDKALAALAGFVIDHKLWFILAAVLVPGLIYLIFRLTS
jgi:hypothetical protein